MNSILTATLDALQNLITDLKSDTRNVLLTLARIWSTVETDTIRSKLATAYWAISCLPEQYQPVMQRAQVICNGEAEEYWNVIIKIITPCANFIIHQINQKISKIMLSDCSNKFIKVAE